jgi:hypothetical protein
VSSNAPVPVQQVAEVRAAVVAAAVLVIAREKDGSFLERTLRDALARCLPGVTRTEQRIALTDWTGRLGGVDVVYRQHARTAWVGIETKVWDVEDSLFDLFKLAAGIQHGDLAGGCSVIAGRPRDWRGSGPVCAMARGAQADWQTAKVLAEEETRWAGIWARCPARPLALPAQFTTVAADPVAMPRVPGHEIRIIGIRPVGDARVTIDERGQATTQ